MDKEIFSTKEASEFLGISESKLAQMRCNGTSPPYSKPTGKIFYFKEDLINWLNDHKQKIKGKF